MKTARNTIIASPLIIAVATLVGVLALTTTIARADDLSTALGTGPLPSWNDAATKQAIVDFVGKVTKEGSTNFVPVPERVATFDNDGTLWCEQPMYFQFLFALDRVKVLAPKHPEWKNKQPFKAVLEGDMKAVAATGVKGMLEIVAVTHAGMSTAEFEEIVKDWIATAKHPKFKRP